MKAVEISDGEFLVMLTAGDDLRACLKRIAMEHHLTAAEIRGVGAVEEVELGWFDLEEGAYRKKKLSGRFELVSAQGNISILDHAPFVHLHVTVSDSDFKVYGGHLFDCKVSVIGEFFLTKKHCVLSREYHGPLALLDQCRVL